MTLAIVGPLTNFGLLFPVVCFVFVWPSFIGAVLSVIKVYRSYTLVPEVFFCHKETREERERKKQREKTCGCGRYEYHYHATIGVRRID